KAQARTRDTLMVHIVDAVGAVVKVEAAQPTANISDLHLTRFMFRSTDDAVRAVCEALECSHPSSSEGSESIRSSPPASSVASDDDDNHIVASDSAHLVTIDSTLPIAPPCDGSWLEPPPRGGEQQTLQEIQDWAKTKKARRRELWAAYVIEEAAERNVGDARPLTTTRGHNDRARCTYCINVEQSWDLARDTLQHCHTQYKGHPLPITTAYHLGLAGKESPSTEDINLAGNESSSAEVLKATNGVLYTSSMAYAGMNMLADCRNLKKITIVGGVGVNSTPEKAAKNFFTESGRLLQALVYAAHGDKDAALDVITFGKKCFTMKEEVNMVEWDEENMETFVELITEKLK
ncbi:hypothetical protein KCU71_g16255, partial [Aureobasidium melanogenum]